MQAGAPSQVREARARSFWDALQLWDPDSAARFHVHCSNCAHAKVFGDPQDPRVRCGRGHSPVGRPDMALGQLIRAVNPGQFRVAKRCEDFQSMS